MKTRIILISLIPIAFIALTACGHNTATTGTSSAASTEVSIEAVEEMPDIFEAVDPFDHLSMVFEGIAPYGTAYYEIDDDPIWLSGVSVVQDRVAGLSNGDIITVHVIYPDKTEKTKEFTVEGLDDYANYQPEEESTEVEEFDVLISEIAEATAEEDPGDAEAVEAEGNMPVTEGPHIVLSSGLTIYPGNKVMKSDLAGATFSLDGLPAGTYWFVDFCNPIEYHAAEDPEVDWAYSAQYQAGDNADLSWSASTCGSENAKWLFIGLRPVNGGDDIEYNFPLQ
nr:hypothetical protein [uncultured Butyrivibrio sp.]